MQWACCQNKPLKITWLWQPLPFIKQRIQVSFFLLCRQVYSWFFHHSKLWCRAADTVQAKVADMEVPLEEVMAGRQEDTLVVVKAKGITVIEFIYTTDRAFLISQSCVSTIVSSL